MRSPGRALDDTGAVYAACAASFAIGLLFIFVWAPHPWGWEGFDHYHDLGAGAGARRAVSRRSTCRGATRISSPPSIGCSATIRGFRCSRRRRSTRWCRSASTASSRCELDRRTAVAAAVLTGFFSFNTVYASTQSSDAVCTVLFMAALVVFAEGRRARRSCWFALAGAARRPRAAVPSEPRARCRLLLAAARRDRDAANRAARSRTWRLLLVAAALDADAVDRPQLPAPRPAAADQHPRRRAAVVRHAAGGPVPARAAPTIRAPRSSRPAFDYTSVDRASRSSCRGAGRVRARCRCRRSRSCTGRITQREPIRVPAGRSRGRRSCQLDAAGATDSHGALLLRRGALAGRRGRARRPAARTSPPSISSATRISPISTRMAICWTSST